MMIRVLVFSALAAIAVWYLSNNVRMIFGGVLMNIGYWSQDGVSSFCAVESPTPKDLWSAFTRFNGLASAVREKFPRTTHHPLVVIVACMDGRLDTNEVLGDSRRFYYVIRTAGSVIDVKEEEMLELAVRNGVKLVVFTRHTDCAAEKVAADPEKARLFPEIAQAIHERDMRLAEFLGRPFIREAVDKGQLFVKLVDIDTLSERALPHRDTGSIFTEPEVPLQRVAH